MSMQNYDSKGEKLPTKPIESGNLAAGDCSAPGPYPTCENVQPSPEAVRMLLDFYASQHSEFSAAATYMYQSSFLRESYPEISKQLHCIGIVEMRHMEILARAILEFGGDPQYYSKKEKTGESVYWSGSYADYSKAVNIILRNDLEAEKSTVLHYDMAADLISIPCLKDLFHRIAMDHRVHAQIITGLIGNL